MTHFQQNIPQNMRNRMHCPACGNGTLALLHSDKEIRALGEALQWEAKAVCEDCYAILRAYRDIVIKGSEPR